jgi:hypothetical protein
MTDTYYALSKIDTRLRDDGTNAQFTLHLIRSDPARFFVSPEGLGMLLKSFKAAALQMAERLNASGKAAAYQGGDFEFAPDRALSIQVGVESPSNELHLAIQTEDGAFTRLLIPTPIALALADKILQLKPKLDPNSSGQTKQ